MKVALSYLLSLAGAGVLTWGVMMAMAVNCNYPAIRFRLLHFLRTQPWQAEMMTRTKPGSFYDGIHAAMKTAGMLGIRDPDQIALATRPTYDAATSTIKFKWKSIMGKLKMGGGLVIAGLGAAIAASTNPALHIIILVGAIIAAIWMFVTKNDCERYVMLARLEILPDVDRCVAEGRYGKPPVV